MTTAIPAGTRNITINVSEAEARILGRLAFDEDRSRGSFLRRAWLDYLRENYPAEADAIAVARRTLKAGAMCLAGFWIVWLSAVGQVDMERRAARFRPSQPRVVRVTGRRVEA